MEHSRAVKLLEKAINGLSGEGSHAKRKSSLLHHLRVLQAMERKQKA